MGITRSIRYPLFVLVLLAISAAVYGQISISISFAPPELPVYEQPLCPGDGYLWTPGYWAYADDTYGYYWVPGTWVTAPEPGLLWTPAYWGWRGNGYVFNEGYWGPQVGFYGGVGYGYGYFGEGYQGGRWQNGQFYYNRSVNNVSITTTNVYNTTITNTMVNRVSYNGGSGGINARPRPEDEAAARARHIPPVAAQTQHERAARTNSEQRASVNRGTPAVAATPRPRAFSDHAVVRARQAATPYNPAVDRAAAQPPAVMPTARPENNAARSDRPAPNHQPESSHPPSTRPEPNREEPAQRPLTPPPSERSQPEHTSPPQEMRPAPRLQPRPQAEPAKAENKKHQDDRPKPSEKPPQ